MTMHSCWICALAAAVVLVGGDAHAQLGLGLPPLGLPQTSLPPMDTPISPRGRAQAPTKPRTDKAASGPVVSSGEVDSIAGGVFAVEARGADGATEIGLKAKGGTTGLVGDLAEATGSYAARARELIQRHGDLVDSDDQGQPVVRGEVVGLGIGAGGLAAARAAGFQVRSQERIAGLGLAAVILVPPRGIPARDAVRRLRSLDPAGSYDLNHLYLESGAVGRGAGAVPAVALSGRAIRIGLVDGAALESAPSLARTRMVQRAFAPGGMRVTAHATAVASLLAGSGPDLRGAAPAAKLYVADVYGPTPTGGSALAVVRGLGWLAEARTPVVNISLVGPSNTLLAAGVAALVAKGHIVVAAVGNDGPGAGPLYPAAYPGVVAVTAVDARRRVLPEAGRGPYVAFAAPGSELLAAGLDGRLTAVRGSSFAAPLAAGRLAQLLPAPDRAGAQRAIATLAGDAIDLGAPGRDPVYGRGLVAFDLAVRPASLAEH